MHTDYFKDVWRDWAIFNWQTEGELPGKISGFVDLERLPVDNKMEYGGMTGGIPPAKYAIIESAEFVENKKVGSKLSCSSMLRPIELEVESMDERGRDRSNHRVKRHKYYLVDIDAIVSTAIVVPDIGGPPNAYFLVQPLDDWAQLFTSWICEPHDEIDKEFLESLESCNTANYEESDGETTDADDSDCESI